jgi:hypothetical protein
LQIGKRLSEDLDSLGAMKVQVMLRRSEWRDYKKERNFQLLNPVYSIDGKDIEELIKVSIRREYLPD